MTDEISPFDTPHYVALYQSIEYKWYSLLEHHPDSPRYDSHVRISEPVEVRFTKLQNSEAIQEAVAALDAREKSIVEEFGQALAKLREQKASLLALTHETES